ncbi:hypothetical protein PAMC26577_28310 [Caballeronia sordidicola]|uniref:Uncharacterized protein n=1 Tax=Caballeronia sordidicola TaxID=196367 RepID=A0A242MFZ2_CABSO|nr:hypothetical protein PAMC26577_28310 [Caballeronia sordidicola]
MELDAELDSKRSLLKSAEVGCFLPVAADFFMRLSIGQRETE